MSIQNAEPSIGVDWTLAFTRPENRKAYAYWDSLRGARSMPMRSELKPRGMREFLTHVNLLAVRRTLENRPTDYEVALQGSHLLGVTGPLAGLTLNAGSSAVTLRRMCECWDLVTESARPVRISARLIASNRSWMDSESSLAPLGDHPDHVTAIMCVFVSWRAPADGAALSSAG